MCLSISLSPPQPLLTVPSSLMWRGLWFTGVHFFLLAIDHEPITPENAWIVIVMVFNELEPTIQTECW